MPQKSSSFLRHSVKTQVRALRTDERSNARFLFEHGQRIGERLFFDLVQSNEVDAEGASPHMAKKAVIGILYDAVAGNDTCNGLVAKISSHDP